MLKALVLCCNIIRQQQGTIAEKYIFNVSTHFSGYLNKASDFKYKLHLIYNLQNNDECGEKLKKVNKCSCRQNI